MPWQRLSRTVQEGSLYALLLLLPFSKAAIELAFPLLVVGWLMEHIRTGWRSSVWRSPAGRRCVAALLAYVGICALSILTSSDVSLSLRGFLRKTAEYALLFVVAADVAKQPVVAKRCLLVVIASAFLVGVDGVAQEIVGREPVLMERLTAYNNLGSMRQKLVPDPLLKHLLPSFNYHRMTGPYENPIDLATYLIVVIPLVLAQMLERRRAAKWALGILLLLLLGCLIRSVSQGAWVGLFAGLVLLGIAHRRFRKTILVGSVAFVAVAGLALQSSARFSGSLKPVDVGTRDRIFMWQAAWRMVQDRPILGHGLNTFMANYLKYWVGGEQQPRYAHNCFLQVAAETGLLGLMAFLWLLGAMGVMWFRAIKLLRENWERSVLLGLMAGLSAFLVQSAFDTNFYALRQAALFWTLAGVATGLSLTVLQREAHHARVA